MIKVGDLEKQDKLKSQKKTKVENQKISDDIKPQKPKKMSYKIPKQQFNQKPMKKYTEYRTAILPLLGGGTWYAYKAIQEKPTDDEYNKIMSSIVASPDLNELISEQLTYLDSTSGYTKTILTCLSKAFNTASRKAMISSNEVSSLNHVDPSQSHQNEHPGE